MHVPVSRIFTTLQSKLASMYINDFHLIGYTFKVKDVYKRQILRTMGRNPMSSIRSTSSRTRALTSPKRMVQR